jgi:hypothetical protein
MGLFETMLKKIGFHKEIKIVDKCTYCNKKSDELYPITVTEKRMEVTYPVCSKECEDKARAYFEFVQSKVLIYRIGSTLALFLVAFSSIVSPLLFVLGLILYGLVLLILPLGYSGSYRFNFGGIQKSILITRICGVVFILIAFVIAIISGVIFGQ